mmetsp:Transcript_7306/g.17310  ORF Transcript_7306/g.17310 Transcript_7306/m.17310 type:complete len:204 (-) Transcript_7306:40-651(-)
MPSALHISWSMSLMENSVVREGPSSVSSPGRVSLSLSASDILWTLSEEGVGSSSAGCLSGAFSSRLGFASLENAPKDVRLLAGGAFPSEDTAVAFAILEKGPGAVRLDAAGASAGARPARGCEAIAGVSSPDSCAKSLVKALRRVIKTCREQPGRDARVMAVWPSARLFSGSARCSRSNSHVAKSPSLAASISKVSSVPGLAI